MVWAYANFAAYAHTTRLTLCIGRRSELLEPYAKPHTKVVPG